MKHASNPLLRLTIKERQLLTMAIQGMSVEQMSVRLDQSPKIVIRHIHRGIRKLETWSLNAIPGQTHHTPLEQELGILNPWQAERRITRMIRDVGIMWACIIVLAIPDQAPDSNFVTSIEAVSFHIHNCVRRTDTITKWSATEWIIFLPSISSNHIDRVTQRLKKLHLPSWSLSVLACISTGDESFNQVAVRGHNELMQQYINRDLGSWGIP